MIFCLIVIVGLFVYVKLSDKKISSFKIIFFNIGQGDSALIKFDDGEKMLIDCGSDKKILSKLGLYLPFYDRTIDYLLISHFDLDHYGGCVDVLKRYDVKNIITNGDEKGYDSYWLAWDEVSRAENADIIPITTSRSWVIASSTLDFFNPDANLVFANANDKTDSNNQSIVLKLSHASTTVLFAGDMETPLENALLLQFCSSTPVDCPALKVNVLKIGHHGSDSSSGEKFLSAVNPNKAVVSVGKNSFGHPSLRVLRKLERIGADILRTDETGDVILP